MFFAGHPNKMYGTEKLKSSCLHMWRGELAIGLKRASFDNPPECRCKFGERAYLS
jgi:hypothetical protein